MLLFWFGNSKRSRIPCMWWEPTKYIFNILWKGDSSNNLHFFKFCSQIRVHSAMLSLEFLLFESLLLSRITGKQICKMWSGINFEANVCYAQRVTTLCNISIPKMPEKYSTAMCSQVPQPTQAVGEPDQAMCCIYTSAHILQNLYAKCAISDKIHTYWLNLHTLRKHLCHFYAKCVNIG